MNNASVLRFWLWAFVAGVLVTLRVAGLTGVFSGLHPIWFQLFKDAAHFVVCGVLVAWVVGRKYQLPYPWAQYGWVGLVMSVVEIGAAVVTYVRTH